MAKPRKISGVYSWQRPARCHAQPSPPVEIEDSFDWMASIPVTGDDQEMWACEGAILELRYARDNDCKTDAEREACDVWLRKLGARHSRLKYDDGDDEDFGATDTYVPDDDWTPDDYFADDLDEALQ